MTRTSVLIALLCVTGLAAVLTLVPSTQNRLPTTDPRGAALGPTSAEQPPRRAGRIAPAPDPAWLAVARAHLKGGGRELGCGPYQLLTDVADRVHSELCRTLADDLEKEYPLRLGVSPTGRPRGAVLVFAQREDFHRFVRSRTSLASGYAGFSRPARSIVALPATIEPEALCATLAHELAHLLHRRAFGPDLPPWLSEGLADALADGAEPSGLASLDDLTAIVPLAARRLAAPDNSSRPLAELLALARHDFDREARALDYELSALLVRFLLLDPELGPRFRAFLRELGDGARYEPARLLEELGLEPDSLETRLLSWLAAMGTNTAGSSSAGESSPG